MYNFDAIPSELKILSQWCTFKLEVVDGKKTKVPYSPKTGHRASTTDPSTWSIFEAARAAYQDLERYDGICFMLAKENGIVFVDLDDCIEDGIIMGWALNIAKLLNSYTERSQSGKGLHILVKGLKPGNRCRRADYPRKIEIYSHSRQCCLTGDLVAV
jgi:primase-polymerase (primpol)-like protein